MTHLVSPSHPLPTKVQAIVNFPQPTSRRKLRTFFGRFIPVLQSLTHTQCSPSLTHRKTRVSSTQAIKEALATAILLIHPKPTALTTNTSSSAVGAVLQQHVGGHWQPISFFSKKLKPSETRYSTLDQELLAVYLSINIFDIFSKAEPSMSSQTTSH